MSFKKIAWIFVFLYFILAGISFAADCKRIDLKGGWNTIDGSDLISGINAKEYFNHPDVLIIIQYDSSENSWKYLNHEFNADGTIKAILGNDFNIKSSAKYFIKLRKDLALIVCNDGSGEKNVVNLYQGKNYVVGLAKTVKEVFGNCAGLIDKIAIRNKSDTQVLHWYDQYQVLLTDDISNSNYDFQNPNGASKGAMGIYLESKRDMIISFYTEGNFAPALIDSNNLIYNFLKLNKPLSYYVINLNSLGEGAELQPQEGLSISYYICEYNHFDKAYYCITNYPRYSYKVAKSTWSENGKPPFFLIVPKLKVKKNVGYLVIIDKDMDGDGVLSYIYNDNSDGKLDSGDFLNGDCNNTDPEILDALDGSCDGDNDGYLDPTASGPSFTRCSILDLNDSDSDIKNGLNPDTGINGVLKNGFVSYWPDLRALFPPGSCNQDRDNYLNFLAFNHSKLGYSTIEGVVDAESNDYFKYFDFEDFNPNQRLPSSCDVFNLQVGHYSGTITLKIQNPGGNIETVNCEYPPETS